MWQHRLKYHLVALACALCGALAANGDTASMKKLKQTITKVRRGLTLTARAEASEELARLTNRIDPQKVDDETLAELVSLLDTSEEPVRVWMAASVGNLGPRAKVAIPTLLKWLPVADCLRESMTSAATIRKALEKIGETPPRADLGKCK